MAQSENRPTGIQIVFVSPKGETENGPLLPLSDQPARIFDDSPWDRDRCLLEFPVFLQSHDGPGLEAAMRAMDRLDCWHEAFAQLAVLDNREFKLGYALLSFWISYGFHIMCSLKGDEILPATFRQLLPAYSGPSMTLYRGELYSRYCDGSRGIAWTSKFEVARIFADRRASDEGVGVILRTEASPEMIIARVGGHLEAEEEEYLVDYRMLHRIDEI